MNSLKDSISEYQNALSKGHIQKAYRGIMSFMTDLKGILTKHHPDYLSSALYTGYLDMTYFAFTPSELRNMKLKVAIVYLHDEGRFEVWLSGNNRKIQAEYIKRLSHINIEGYQLSKVMPGVDSIIESIIINHPDFDHPIELKKLIEGATLKFIQDINHLINN